MNRTLRIILLISAIVLVVGYIIGSLVYVGTQQSQQTCSGVVYEILDIDQRQYVTEAELSNMLRQQGLSIVGQSMRTQQIQAIEDAVRAHAMVRTAECFPTADGLLHICLTQRVPMLRIITNSESYFVDTDLRRMPVRDCVRDDVLTAEGNIGERMATEELAEFTAWLAHNRYWRDRVAKIRVRNPKHIEIIQHGNEPTILLGDLGDYSRKLRRVRTFYEKGVEKMAEPKSYRELDVRFNGQVVAR